MDNKHGDDSESHEHVTLPSGALLSHYRVIEKIGAGGMGEVYRAQDTRLGRDVAIKVLSPHLAATPEARARFEREARTISQLNHPHICTLHDIGHQDGMDYLVMELLEGETLAHRLDKGPLPVPELLTLGAQIAEALDVAHRRGIVHRDLKPGNVMLTKAGVKLMDFGLARVSTIVPTAGAEAESPTVSRPLTSEGTIVGTFQYMAPEQLEGREADVRSDIWALGCVLYEMATGKPSFEGTSQASLIAGIMEREPPAITVLQPLTPPALERIVKHCLEKDPDKRFQSARDLAFALESVSGSAAGMAAVEAAKGAPRRARLVFVAAAFLAGAVLVATIALLFARRPHLVDPSRVTYTQLTIQRGTISSARFSPDGKTVFYSAEWDGCPQEVFETRPGFPTSRAVGLAEARLLSISRNGTMAVLLGATWFFPRGTLAEVPISGGAPRRVLDDVGDADWLPDGETLAVTHYVGGKARLEMPPGHVLYETAGDLSTVRFSRDGKWLAFADHPLLGDSRGCIVIMDTAGRVAAKTAEWNSLQGAAWSADGREVCFCASRDLASSDFRALSPDGKERVVARFIGRIFLWEIAQDGQVLLTRESSALGIRGRTPMANDERELGWFDWPWVADISADGKSLLFDEQGIYGGPLYAVCLRGMDGSPPVRLGEGHACSLSPDGKWAMAIHYGTPQRLVLLPTGAGDSTSLARGQIDKYYDARWLPDGKSIVLAGSEAGHAQRTYLQDLQGTPPRPITPEGMAGVRVSPDGRFVAAVSGDERLYVCPTDSGSPRLVTQLLPGEVVLQWTPDEQSVYVRRWGTSADVSLIEIGTGRREAWKTFNLPDPTGAGVYDIVLTPDGRSYAYTYARHLDDLYLVDGLE
jgi:Tol biopolymer transport system component